MRLTLPAMAFLMCAPGLSGCGFTPLYADAAVENGRPLQDYIKVGAIAAPESVQTYLYDALNERLAFNGGETPRYVLSVEAKETAQRLAVQTDATVTRYNYRLTGDYRLTNLQTGEVIKGRVGAVTSYNIVSSQYSTLFAEKNAQEKAARLLAEDIERNLLFTMTKSENAKDVGENDDVDYDKLIAPSDERNDGGNNENDPFAPPPMGQPDDGVERIGEGHSGDGSP